MSRQFLLKENLVWTLAAFARILAFLTRFSSENAQLHLREDVGEQPSRGSFALTSEGPLWVELPAWEEMLRSVSGGSTQVLALPRRNACPRGNHDRRLVVLTRNSRWSVSALGWSIRTRHTRDGPWASGHLTNIVLLICVAELARWSRFKKSSS